MEKVLIDKRLHNYGTGLVKRNTIAIFLARAFGFRAGLRYWRNDELTFDHVLNVPASEEVWPGDAIMLFNRELFVVRLFGDEEIYRFVGPIYQHMRDELLRMSDSSEVMTLESIYKAQHQLSCYFLNGSFANEIFGDDISSYDPHNTNWDAEPFSEDDDEEDTLNSELLLTKEYLLPAEVEALKSRPLGGRTLDRVSSIISYERNSVGPQCRVEPNQPTEQEE